MTGSDPRMGKHTRKETRIVPVVAPAGPYAQSGNSFELAERLGIPERSSSYWSSPAPARTGATASPEAGTRGSPPAPRSGKARKKATRKASLLRVAAVVTGFASLAAIGSGATLGLYSATTGTEHDNVAAGTLSFGTPVSTVCNVGTGAGETATPLYPTVGSTGYTPAPAHHADAPCTLQVSYAGTVPGYLALDVTIATKPGTVQAGAPSGTTALPLFNESGTGLQFQLTDTRNGATKYYAKGTKYLAQGGSGTPATTIPTATCPVGYTSSYTCYKVTDLLVSTTAFTSSSTPDIFSVNYALPSASKSGQENGTAVLILSVHAVQSKHQPLPGTCAAASRCTSGISWS